MTQNVQFPVAVHVLVALALLEDEYVSSEVLADSVGTNSAVVRRLLQVLKRAELVKSRSGVYGGSAIARAPEEITLLDVQRAVAEECAPPMHDCDSTCWIAHGIQAVVPGVLAGADAARSDALARATIADVARDVSASRP